MYEKFLLSDKATQLLKQTGLQDRIEHFIATLKESDEDDLSFLTYRTRFFQLEDLDFVARKLKKEGYYAHLPVKEEERNYFNRMIKKPSLFHWRINNTAVACNEVDAMISLGYYASKILDVEEFGNTFGFDHFSDLFYAIGISMRSLDPQNRFNPRFYSWKNKHGELRYPGGPHGDFYLDFTQSTIPKVNNYMNQSSGLYVPIVHGVNRVGLYEDHHSEPYFLGKLLRYVRHHNVHSDIVQNPLDFLKLYEKKDQVVGPYSDFGHDNDWFIESIGLEYHHSFDRLAKLDHREARVERFGRCFIKVNEENELVFWTKDKEPDIIITPDDVDHAIKGLFHVTQQGVNRTSVRDLANVMTTLLD